MINKKLQKQNSLAKAIEIIDYISSSKRPISITNISENLDIPITTAHRLLHQLLENRIIKRFPNKKFYISKKLLDISINVINNNIVANKIHFIIEQIVLKTNETCNLSIQNLGNVVYCDRVESRHWPYQITLPIGSILPMYCTASGKMFLAFSINRKSKINSFIHMQKIAKNTITSKKELQKELKAIYKNKYSTDNEEYVDGMVAIAVPIFVGDEKHPMFSLSIHAPKSRKSLNDLILHLSILNKAAEDISKVYQDY